VKHHRGQPQQHVNGAMVVGGSLRFLNPRSDGSCSVAATLPGSPRMNARQDPLSGDLELTHPAVVAGAAGVLHFCRNGGRTPSSRPGWFTRLARCGADFDSKPIRASQSPQTLAAEMAAKPGVNGSQALRPPEEVTITAVAA
jgi:hypothetical protein